MFIYSVFVFSLFFSFNGNAESTLRDFVTELLTANSKVLESQTLFKQSKIDLKLHKASQNWSLFYDMGLKDSKLESAPFFTSSPQKNYNYTLGVKKNWYNGGELILSNTANMTKGSNPFGGLNGEINGFTQSISYSLDFGANFLGRRIKKEFQVLQEKKNLNKKRWALIEDEKILELSLNFTQVKLAISNVDLNTEALERAKKRERLIRSRVQDGLKLKVDLYQSEITTQAQKEALFSSIVLKDQSLETLGKQVHRAIEEREMTAFDFKKNETIKKVLAQRGARKDNKSMIVLERQLAIVVSNLEISSYSRLPAIKMSASYLSNDYDSDLSKALDRGKIGADTREIQLSLNLNWSIGSESASLSKERYFLEESLIKRKKENLAKNILLSERTLLKKIEILNQNLESAQKRKSLARKVLKEYNKLYNRGRVDLDNVIRAEESLISTELSFVNFLSERNKASYQLAYLYGNISTYILGYKE